MTFDVQLPQRAKDSSVQQFLILVVVQQAYQVSRILCSLDGLGDLTPHCGFAGDASSAWAFAPTERQTSIMAHPTLRK